MGAKVSSQPPVGADLDGGVERAAIVYEHAVGPEVQVVDAKGPLCQVGGAVDLRARLVGAQHHAVGPHAQRLLIGVLAFYGVSRQHGCAAGAERKAGAQAGVGDLPLVRRGVDRYAQQAARAGAARVTQGTGCERKQGVIDPESQQAAGLPRLAPGCLCLLRLVHAA